MVIPMPILIFNRTWLIKFCHFGLYMIVLLCKFFCGISWKIEGKENIPKEPFILASKHLSAWETLFFSYYFGIPVYIFKRILLHIPIFGWYMWLTGMIGIKRSGGSSTILQIQKSAVDVIKNQKRVLIIFPQGTRTPVDSTYKIEKYPYKKGILGITQELKETPVLCATHNAVKFFGKGFFSKKQSGTITVRFMPPIKRLETEGTTFLSQIQDIIENETQKLF
jgi:1-acyl-sn-glycerol-3-phosphate acyltransferase